MMSDDVEAVTVEHIDDIIVNLSPYRDVLMQLVNGTDALMSAFCECSPGGANASSPHCLPLVNDYNITLLELCNDRQLLLQQNVVQVGLLYVLHLLIMPPIGWGIMN